MKPILFLDVDGPLNPYKAKPTQRPKGYITIRARPSGTEWEDSKNRPLRVWLDPSHGPELLKLPYDLVWATSWMHEANTWIGPHIGLPELPVVEFREPPFRGRLHWKTERLIAYADGRPFVWVDDEATPHDAAHITRVCGPHGGEVYRVNPVIGLTVLDFDRLADLAGRLS